MNKINNYINKLRNKIYKLNYEYIINNNSVISDTLYDNKLSELLYLEKKNNCNKNNININNISCNLFCKNKHKLPIYSIKKTNNFNELNNFFLKNNINIKLNKINYCCELKIDGLAINILYKYGKLICATTKGNGYYGEDVTNNVKVIKSIPLYLKNNLKTIKYIEIRGEVFIYKDDFIKLNNKNFLFKNSRNASSGSLRQLNYNITASRPLSFIPYSIGYVSDYNLLPKTQYELLIYLKKNGFCCINKIKIFNKIQNILNYINYIKNNRKKINVDIDGIVIKINNLLNYKLLNNYFTYFKYILAYKFNDDIEVISKIISLNYNINRNGNLIPILNINKVYILGTYINKIYIYNFNIINKLNLMIGDYISIGKSGGIIPIIKRVLIEKRNNNVKKIIYPLKCIFCESNIIKILNNNSISLKCNSKLMCIGQLKSLIKHYVSKKAFNISIINTNVIKKLIKINLLTNILDLYKLTLDNKIFIKNFGYKKSLNIFNSINISKNIKLSKFIYSLSIPHVGEIISINLSKKFITINNFINCKLESLLSVKLIGKKIAKSILFFLKNKKNIFIIKKLINNIKINFIN